jgi:hypothetical protein
MKKLSLVAVAVCLFVGSSVAGWNKFGVISDGSAEMKLGYYGGWWLGVRYGLMENLELYSTISGVAEDQAYAEIDGENDFYKLLEHGIGFSSQYVVGARYQIIPMLSGFLDLAFPTMKDKGSYDFGLRPGVNFTMNFSDKLSFGSVLQAGITLAPDSIDIEGAGKQKNGGAIIDFKVGVELDYMFSDNIGAWLGVDFVYDDMTNSLPWHGGDEFEAAKWTRKFDAAGAVKPGFGFFFTKDNLTVGTLLEFNLAHLTGESEDLPANAPAGTDPKPKKTVGLSGGVEFAVKF